MANSKAITKTDVMIIVEEQVQPIKKYLFGNGVPGMDEQLRNIITYINEEKERRAKREKEHRDSQLYYLRLTVGTAITSVVVLLVNGVIYFAKILPLLEKLK